MKESIVAKRYGEAFVAFARERIGLERVVEDVKNLDRLMHDNPEFLSFLKSPEIEYSEKCLFVDKVLEKGFAGETAFFLKFLIEKRRFAIIETIADYVRVNYAHGETVTALLKTSYPLDLDIMAALKSRLEEKYHKKFNLYLELDASLKGGVQVTIGNTIIDGSIRHRLEELREKLKSVRVV